MRSCFLLLFATTVLTCKAALGQQDYDQRARDIVRQMTLDEKIQQLHGIRSDAHYRYVPPTHGWKTINGEYQAMIGASSRDIRLQEHFIVK